MTALVGVTNCYPLNHSIHLLFQKAYPGDPKDGLIAAELLWRKDSLRSIPPTLGDPDEASLNLNKNGNESFIQFILSQ